MKHHGVFVQVVIMPTSRCESQARLKYGTDEVTSWPVGRRVQVEDEESGGGSGMLAWAVNIAWHARFATSVTEPSEQSVSPDHPPNVDPAAGDAVSVTVVFAEYVPAPPTVPVPVPKA